jgi:hypothetical protein
MLVAKLDLVLLNHDVTLISKMKGANIIHRSYLFAKLHCKDHNTKVVGENRYQ